jgi:hypothetical protein
MKTVEKYFNRYNKDKELQQAEIERLRSLDAEYKENLLKSSEMWGKNESNS